MECLFVYQIRNLKENYVVAVCIIVPLIHALLSYHPTRSLPLLPRSLLLNVPGLALWLVELPRQEHGFNLSHTMLMGG